MKILNQSKLMQVFLSFLAAYVIFVFGKGFGEFVYYITHKYFYWTSEVPLLNSMKVGDTSGTLAPAVVQYQVSVSPALGQR